VARGELPAVVGGKMRLGQVFHHLIDNAIKYMDKPQGRIEIGCTDQGSVWQFGVTDNGPGIEERHFEKIFQMFQTLAPRDQCESTGIGLPIVKKIVELFGGRIWVESKPGVGSTFFFTLPKQGPPADNVALAAKGASLN
ncbi:MAG: ATP-binding protein, partial [Planctomycetes bacterium]|nr:ATP-binding protein [Planctomycetota bacterium]